jgi:hypothetical protein
MTRMRSSVDAPSSRRRSDAYTIQLVGWVSTDGRWRVDRIQPALTGLGRDG